MSVASKTNGKVRYAIVGLGHIAQVERGKPETQSGVSVGTVADGVPYVSNHSFSASFAEGMSAGM